MEDKKLHSIPGHLEQLLSQRVTDLYLNQLGHKPNNVSCKIIDRTLTIIVENPITQPERLLVESGKLELAEQVRSNIHKVVQIRMKALIEELLKTPVIDLLSNSAYAAGRSSFVAILAVAPGEG